ncbi:D-2-hydroxyacid dehydrogenase [Salinisphaera orenii MK-B5]|uniref:D-2-hydroxyacid dehydrogenase n=1 Tax=Salinisphaera orenii MK-B5 TaxID=856730 RepID=A0A423PH21_9GAMM|nr:FAD-binding oxidoreductase [Salinisphaera orenii]ROO24912.1 D-2-hydroxyacid dehydrogenase [Salinisphaera orenii MK-B5]
MAARILEALAGVVGADEVLTGDAAQPYLQEWRGAFQPRALAVVRPADTAMVAAVVRACIDADCAIVAQSGNTGLVGGCAADDARRHVILSLERLSAVRGIDVDNATLTVEAGCTLADAQRAAADAGLYFPLTLASRERCRIGGNLATNAGGLNVVHYGNTRDLVLGLEVVTADGRVWDNLTGLRKDNSGFDLNDLFVGSEGALGIITAAVFKLHSPIVQQSVALFGLDTPAQAVGVQRRLTAASGHNLTGCELMSRQAVALACAHIEGCAEPFEAACDWYLLVELASSASGDWLAAALGGAIADLRAEGIVRSVRVAADAAGARDIWHLRESLPPAQVAEGASIKHDISLPVSRLPAFLDRALPAVREALPGVRPCPFGHVGDGNLHFNLSKPAGSDDAAFLSETARANAVVHDIVAEMGGSFAAEHGIGRLKVAALARYKQPVERDMLIAIKRALDPDNRLNPGAVVDLDAPS